MTLKRNWTDIVLGFSAIAIIQLYDVFLLLHGVMVVIIFNSFVRSRRYAIVSLVGFSLYCYYAIFLYYINGIGINFYGESAKLILMLACTYALVRRDYDVVLSMRVFALALSVSLLAYIIISDRYLIYGGRLGVGLSDADETRQISANTIGLAINMAIATLLANWRRLYIVPTIILFYCLFLTESRGAIISAALVFVMFLSITKNRMALIFIGMAIIILAILVDHQGLIDMRLTDDTLSGRLLLYPLMVSDITSSLGGGLLGFGPGAVNYEIYPGKVLISAHNGYLQAIYTFGVIGWMAIILLLRFVLYKSRSLDTCAKLYLGVLMLYAISEDLLGAHTLLLISLGCAVIFKTSRKSLSKPCQPTKS